MNNIHGIYIHIPFCSHACSYCDFHFSTQTRYIPDMCAAIRKEMELRKEDWINKNIISIYFGGGTPGMLPTRELELFFKAFHDYGWLQTVKEITLEVNPENVKVPNIHLWNALGINRISLGIQSLKAEDLKWMLRTHSVEQSVTSVGLINEHFKGTMSIDLIFGTPFKTIPDLKKELEFVINLEINHLSCYQLTVEEKTLLKKDIERKKISLPSEDDFSEQYMFIHEFLTCRGFEHYEISNYAKPGYRAIHNSLYWKGYSYSGFGPSAHSFDGKNKRWKNISNNHEYMRRVIKNEPWFEVEILNEQNIWNEYILTRLRTSDGLNQEEMKILFSNKQMKHFIHKIKSMPEEWFQHDGCKISLSGIGMLYADYVAQKLFE